MVSQGVQWLSWAERQAQANKSAPNDRQLPSSARNYHGGKTIHDGQIWRAVGKEHAGKSMVGDVIVPNPRKVYAVKSVLNGVVVPNPQAVNPSAYPTVPTVRKKPAAANHSEGIKRAPRKQSKRSHAANVNNPPAIVNSPITTTKEPGLVWNYEMRYTVHLLFSYSITTKQRQLLFNDVFQADIAKCGFKEPFPYSRIGQQNGEGSRPDRQQKD
ncbi:uncharacterized protein RCC_09920 [Ramularia collo-cygni]|uniref:Uncharacterized protein n=1 Tax=Ramularia collo-cygni TaxID=112498 RepID=A0A2D3V873_9PEZI|nr:uncharacterized protein RCC_09920 [Ramularia collo-cygni]CZT24203.1 uncharacterized protein RCC_09920 [Ramularia collo-cygni]